MGHGVPTLQGYEDLPGACYEQSLKLLRQNSSPHGIVAAARTKQAAGRRYTNIFVRDATIFMLAYDMLSENSRFI